MSLRTIGFIAVPVFMLASLAYVCFRTWRIAPFPTWGKALCVAVLLSGLAAVVLGYGGTADRLPLWLARALYLWAGAFLMLFLYLWMAFLLADLLAAVRLLPGKALDTNSIASAVVFGGVALLLLAGRFNYDRKVRVPLRVETSRPLPQGPVRLVLCSDLHLGYHNTPRDLARWLRMLEAENPRAVLIAGDIVDRSIRAVEEQDFASVWKGFAPPVYAVPGNHDHYADLRRAEKFLGECGISLLRDSVALVGGVGIVGRDDRTNSRRAPLDSLVESLRSLPSGEDCFRLLLDHQPYALEQAQQAGVDFQFSGHTHRGQVWPASWIVDAIFEDGWGPYRKGGTEYYVSSGLGIWGPRVRIGTRSEYIVLDIVPSQGL